MVEKISVIVVNFNAGSYLLDAVSSALLDAHEVIVVDNASSDGSLATLEATFLDHPKIKIIRQIKNLGFAKACNDGFKQISGSFIFFLNPDCKVEPGALTHLLQAIQADEKVGMVGGLLLNPDGSEQAGGRRAIPTPWRAFVRAFGLNKLSKRWPNLFFDFHRHQEALPQHPIEIEAISGACMLVRRQAMLDVGLLDEKYFMHCEDLDWCVRFGRKGWKILFVPSARIIHFKGACSQSRPIFVEWHKHKGMMRFYRKLFRREYPGALMSLVLAGVLFRFLLAMIYYSTRRIKQVFGLSGR